MAMKVEADNNDVTECTHDARPITSNDDLSVFSIFPIFIFNTNVTCMFVFVNVNVPNVFQVFVSYLLQHQHTTILSTTSIFATITTL